MSSSEDEVLIKDLQEATNTPFFNESLFHSEKSVVEKKENNDLVKVNNKSLRQNKEKNEHFQNFGLPQTFRDFIAKKLEEVLDKGIKEEQNLAEKNWPEKNDEKMSSTKDGIRLLSCSEEILLVEEEIDDTVNINNKNKKIKNEKDESINDLKIQEAAVSPDRILSKSDIEMWRNRRKGKEFKYKKLKNGSLVEVNDENI